VKVSVSNFELKKSENLDNAFYVFLTKKRKKSRFLDFEKNVKTYSRSMAFSSTFVIKRKCCPKSSLFISYVLEAYAM